MPWGISRVGADISSTLAGNGSGAVSNVNVYIIDTGGLRIVHFGDTRVLCAATISDREGKKLTIAQARERLKEPTPILLAIAGERVDPIYLKIMTKETMIVTFAWFPEFKAIAKAPGLYEACASPLARVDPTDGSRCGGVQVP